VFSESDESFITAAMSSNDSMGVKKSGVCTATPDWLVGVTLYKGWSHSVNAAKTIVDNVIGKLVL